MRDSDITHRLFTTPQAADYLSLSPHTLRLWASQGVNLKTVRIGRAVRYDRAELDRFVEDNTCESRTI